MGGSKRVYPLKGYSVSLVRELIDFSSVSSLGITISQSKEKTSKILNELTTIREV